MGYKVLIDIGKGKNRTVMGSTILPNRQRVSNWVKTAPVGNWKTQISVTNLRTKKVMVGSKAKFSSPRFRF